MIDDLLEEKVYRYWLCRIPGIGTLKIKQLLEAAGSGEEIWKADEIRLAQLLDKMKENAKLQQTRCAMNNGDIRRILENKGSLYDCPDSLKRLAEQNIHFLTPADDEYPDRLRILYDMPQGLYYRGCLPEADRLSVSIVGSRRCSDYGTEIASYLGKNLVMRGVSVISGMAEGIDGAAHRGAIEGIHMCGSQEKRDNDNQQNGKTYAVLGSGVDRCYPIKNMDIYKELQGNDPIWDCGGVMSEYPVGMAPISGNFPRRNRIISALADILVVVEAKIKSGSLITADQALEQGKDVFVIPGRINDILSQGCNNLIAQGAAVITNLDSFLDEVCPVLFEKEGDLDKIKKNLAMDEKMVYSCLDFIPKHIGFIQESTGLELRKVLTCMQKLQNIGLAKECAKNFYALKLT